VVSLINLKGGVGKSTLTMMLGEYLAFHHAKSVLLIDMDAQANLSYCMVPEQRIEEQQQYGRTTYDLFKAVLSGRVVDIETFITQPPLVVSNIARSAMVKHGTKLQMVVSTPRVAELDEDLLSMWQEGLPMPQGIRLALRDALAPALSSYDYVLIDCPPGLSLFSSSALVASDFFVSPIIPEPLSLLGVELVKDRSRELRESRAVFKGVILNIVKHFRNTHQRVAAQRTPWPIRSWVR
jgi:chromosome partitioning protein